VDVLNGQAIDYHDHASVIQCDASNLGTIPREFESAFLQPLIIQGKADALPMQELDFIPSLVDENKNIAIAWVASKIVADKAGQPIETLAHIGGLAVKVELVTG
jgi:hypothetical protein